VTDLAVHVVAVGMVIVACRACGERALQSSTP